MLWSSTQSCLSGQALEVPLSATSLIITTVLLVGVVVPTVKRPVVSALGVEVEDSVLNRSAAVTLLFFLVLTHAVPK